MEKKSIHDAKEYYSVYDVENRIKRDKAHYIEFFISMDTINKYIKHEMSIIDIGCGTGNYSITLSKKCKDILATDLMDNLLDILRKKIKEQSCDNISCLCTDVLNLPNLVHKKYDLILCMGPLYHLNNKKSRFLCYNNLKKISNKNSVFIFTYLSTSACLSRVLKGKMKLSEFIGLFKKEKFYYKPFYFSSPDLICQELKSNSFEILEHVALDPISSFCVDAVNSFTETQYKDFINTILQQKSNHKLLSLSSHNMLVAKLKKEC